MYEYPSIIMHMKITYEERKEMSQMSIPGGFTPQFRRLETGVPM